MSGTDPAVEDLRRERAEALDAKDPLAAFRDRFHVPPGLERPRVYLCGHSLGLQPRTAEARVKAELEDWRRLAVDAHFEGRDPWFPYHEGLRDPLARLVGARPEEVVAMNGLTANLHLMMVSFYRPRGRRRKIVIEEHAFPSDLYAVRSQIAFHGGDPDRDLIVLRAREGESAIRDEDAEAAIADAGDSLALLMFGGVNYFSGQAFPIRRLTEAAHAVGAVAGFDLAHAAGNVVLDLHAWDVDFAVWCGYKYLNGGPGCIAAAFVHQRFADAVDLPRFAGWWGNDPETRFRMHLEDRFVPRRGADGWQLSNPPILAMAPLKASLEIFDRATMPALREKSVRLTGYLDSLVRSRLEGRLEILTPSAPERRGCQLSLRVHTGDPRAVARALTAHDVTVDFRPPDVLRAAPVPLYNRFADVWDFVDRLSHALDADGETR